MMRAIVIGGGIGGLTAAVALRRKGVDVAVFERSPEIRGVGAGLSLWPNAVKALGLLGLAEELGGASEDGAVRSADGTFLARTPRDAWQRHFGGGIIVVHRAELLALLARDVDVRLGHACTEIVEDAAGVTARFANGAEARGDVLIGADGLHSVVRKWLGHTDAPRYSGYTAWRAVVPFAHSAMVPGETIGQGRRFGMLPVPGGRVYWFATCNAPEGDRSLQVRGLFTGWHAPIEELLRATEDGAILRNDIYDREPLAWWGKGRVTLLGDAAHPMTPNMGQGGCQAMEDAVVLAAELARGWEGLRTYEARRMERTRKIVMASRRLGDVWQWENRVACGVRNWAVRMTPLSLMLRSVAEVAGYEGHLAGG